MYFKEYFKKYDLTREQACNKIGGIVMNCNPFTNGHRYLIEKAQEQVDLLYIFVVEEDKSYFSFDDRFRMVKDGTNDLKKVKVVPSGKYILSKDTFSQYFSKDQIKEIEDMDYDIHIWGDVVAKQLGINCRFVGEEPFDRVTRKYNDTMKRLLPEKGIAVVELPRKTQGNFAISASLVRRYMEDGNMEEIDNIVPETTKRVVEQKMINSKVIQ